MSVITLIASLAFSASVQSANAGRGQILEICNGEFSVIPSSKKPSGGCVVETEQTLSDPEIIGIYGASAMDRRYIVYAPKSLPQDKPVPVVFAYHGASVNAETMAFFDTRKSFETLADKYNFLVIYPNGLPYISGFVGQPPGPDHTNHGYFQGCALPHQGEHVDIQFTRQIIDEIEQSGITVDRNRVYAAGSSAGGGMALTLAMEAPDLVAGIAISTPVPFHFETTWEGYCNTHPNSGTVPMVIVAGTSDPVIPYEYTETDYGWAYPGMETFRDSWLNKMGITGTPKIVSIKNRSCGDSYFPHTGVKDSFAEAYLYPKGSKGANLLYYKITAMGHGWPNPVPSYTDYWQYLGKNNQDFDFAKHAWKFFTGKFGK